VLGAPVRHINRTCRGGWGGLGVLIRGAGSIVLIGYPNNCHNRQNQHPKNYKIFHVHLKSPFTGRLNFQIAQLVSEKCSGQQSKKPDILMIKLKTPNDIVRQKKN
jgi:hypothetical protein